MKREVDLQELVTWLCLEATLDVHEFYDNGERNYVVDMTAVFEKLKKLAGLTDQELGALVQSGEEERVRRSRI